MFMNKTLYLCDKETMYTYEINFDENVLKEQKIPLSTQEEYSLIALEEDYKLSDEVTSKILIEINYDHLLRNRTLCPHEFRLG